ncbi:MAG TPA: DUF3106 domain-containing protein [Alphaproteobacteria bacterium]|nr:DUF3106 domain-containing protein [Alphaproteobacteria bacterium]
MKNLAKMGAIALMFCLTAAPAWAEDIFAPADTAAVEAPTEAVPVHAQDKLEAFKAMSPEQRKAAMEARREEMKNMSPEDRAAAKEQRKAAFQSLSDEQKQQFKAAMKERGGERRFKGRGGE